MANIKIIDLSTGSPESTSYIEATQVDSQAASGRSSVKVNMAEFGNWIAGQGNSPLEYNDLKTEDDTPIGGINELHDSIGADVFDPNTSYTAGMYCIRNNTLYRCKASTSGSWDSSKWEEKTITSLIESKANSSMFNRKLASVPLTNISANDVATVDITVNDSILGMVVGFAIADNTSVVMVQCWFTATNTIRLRVRNLLSNATTFSAYIHYI